MHLRVCIYITLVAGLWMKTMPAAGQGFQAFAVGGATGSQVSGDQLEGFNKAGVVLGIGVSRDLGKRFTLGFEMEFLQKGSRKPNRLDQGDIEQYLMRLNYVEVPVVLIAEPLKNVLVVAGPSVGYLVGSYEENQDGELLNRKAFSSIDVSVFGGIGYDISNHWQFQFRYGQSMLPIRKHGSGEIYRMNRGQYNTWLQFMLSCYFKRRTE